MSNETNGVALIDMHPRRDDFLAEVLAGLRKPQKEIPAKFFYDRRGSELFEEITRLPEYYLTRTEIAILDANAAAIVNRFGNSSVLVEFGSGSSTKVRILLDEMKGRGVYMPVDISKIYLLESAEAISDDYPEVTVVAVCADYTRQFAIPPAPEGFTRRNIFFPGSTVGNLEPPLAHRFFRQTARQLAPGDGMLIGVDLKKDPAILHAAYNDSRGTTAEFNLNVLRRINRELGSNFDLEQFEHHALYRGSNGRVEMHLRSRRDQKVAIGGQEISLVSGETIHTENSYKYSLEDFHGLVSGTGFRPVEFWMDERKMFSVHYLEVE